MAATGCHIPFIFRNMKSIKKNIGLIALSSDLTIERDLHKYSNHNIFTTRIVFENPITRESLFNLSSQVIGAKERLPDNIDYYVFGCTSGTAIIGEDGLSGLINPLSSSLEWLKEYGKKEIGLITPYTNDIHHIVKNWFQLNDIIIKDDMYLGYESDVEIALMDRMILQERILAFKTSCDTVFLSCTALPALDIMDSINNQITYISSNSSIIWKINK